MLGALFAHWKESEEALQHGLSVFRLKFFRLCINENFAGGKLAAKWRMNKTVSPYDDYMPYADIFVAGQKGNTFWDQLGCESNAADVWPTVRRPVYNSSFYITFPNNPKQILRNIYGEWEMPDPKKDRHGVTRCWSKS